jgi:hypothetical protein
MTARKSNPAQPPSRNNIRRGQSFRENRFPEKATDHNVEGDSQEDASITEKGGMADKRKIIPEDRLDIWGKPIPRLRGRLA